MPFVLTGQQKDRIVPDSEANNNQLSERMMDLMSFLSDDEWQVAKEPVNMNGTNIIEPFNYN